MSEQWVDTSEVVDAGIAEGDELFQRGEYRAAIRKWETLVEGGALPPQEASAVGRKIASAHYERARLSANEKRSKKSASRAMERLEEAIRWDPENAVYLFEMGLRHLAHGDLEQADAFFARALKGRGCNARMAYVAAAVKLRIGDVEAALERLRKEEDPDGSGVPQGRWLRLRALAEAMAGRVEEGLKLIAQPDAGAPPEEWVRDVHRLALAAQPSEVVRDQLEAVRQRLLSEGGAGLDETSKLLGDLHLALGEDERAVELWLSSNRPSETMALAVCERRAIRALANEEYDEAEAWCWRAAKSGPNDPVIKDLVAHVCWVKGNALWSSGDKAGAIAAWERSHEAKASLEPLWNVAVAHSDLGDAAVAAESWREVWEAATRVGHEPSAQLAALQRVRALMQQGNVEEARAALETSVKKSSDPALLNLLGYMLLVEGEYGRSIEIFKEVLRSNPDDRDAVVGLAMASDLSEANLETKVDAWEKAVSAADDDDVRLRWRELTLELAMRTWQTGDSAKAMRYFANLLLHDRNDVDGWVWCGMIHLEQGREERASDCFSEAIGIDPKLAETLIKIGGCYLMAGQQDVAESYFAKAFSLSSDPPTLFRIAEVCVKVDRDELAIEHLRQGIRQCQGATPEFYQILRLIIQVSDDDQLRSLIEECHKVAPDSNLVSMLIAIQRLNAADWRAAHHALTQAAEAARQDGDNETLADVEYFSQALILSMTVGNIDRDEFDRRLVTAVDRWVQRNTPASEELAPSERWAKKAKATIEAYRERVDAGDALAIKAPSSRTPEPRLEVQPPRFAQPLNVDQWLGEDPILTPA